ncbi:hypothetical protein [Actinophytocola sp.]|uniref:hypothetical protein n=1 Tax=Actinophytocola sp. TaxID=1872138 RepID=UPI002ED273F8
MSRSGRRAVLLLAALSLVTTACTIKVDGTALPSTGAGLAPKFKATDQVSAGDALGDLPSWNPCSVVDPAGLPKAWTADLDIPVAYEDCVMAVTTDKGVSAEVQVGYLSRSTYNLEDYPDGKRSGGITVVPVDKEDGSCTRDIVFADGIALGVLSWPEDDTDVESVCEISDAVADQVIDSVIYGRATKLELPENSVGEVDPCTLVTPEIATLVPGMPGDVAADPQLHRHSCWWEGPDGILLNIEFEIGYLPEGDSNKQVQGRRTAVSRFADDSVNSLCVVDGEHVPYKNEDKSDLVETVGIWVYLDQGQVEEACTAASAVAEAVWPKLPPL